MRLKNVSASQWSAHQRCARFWHNQSIGGLRTPPGPGQQLGTDIHDGAEKRIHTGKLTTVRAGLQDFVRALEPWMPLPGEEAGVELQGKITTVIGVPWIVKIDLIREYARPLPTVTDWKSTSDMRYAKTPAELLSDIQLMSYGEWAFREFEAAGVTQELLRLQLVYIQTKLFKTKLPNTKAVYIDVDRAHVTRQWEAAKPRLEQMALDSEVKDSADLPPNIRSCGMYGGCPYRARCGINPLAGIGAPLPTKKTQEKTVSSFLQSLKKAKAAGAANGTPTTDTQAAPAEAAPVPQVQQQRAAEPTAGIVPGDAPARDLDPGVPPVETPSEAAIAAAKALLAQAGIDAEAAASTKKRGRPRQVAAESAPDTQAAPAAAATPPAPQPAVAAAAPAVVPEVAAPVPAPAARIVSGVVPAAEVATAGLTLYVDCCPVKRKGDLPPYLEEVFGPVMMELDEWAKEAHKVDAWMLLPFGTQKASLADAVQHRLESGNLPAGILIASGTQLGRDILPLLVPHATHVIRAVR